MTIASTGGKPDLSAYTLRLASIEQVHQHWRAQYVPWHRDQSWEDFEQGVSMMRERLAASGTFRVWALVRRDDYDGRMYAGVESFRRHAFIRKKGQDQIEKTIVYGVSSVVTPVDLFRKSRNHDMAKAVPIDLIDLPGRGYATHMLKLLHYCLADPAHLPPFPAGWGKPPVLSPSEREHLPYAIASMLWSDVGLTFYEKCTIGRDLPGWVTKAEENQEVVWKLQPPKADKEWDWLYAKNILEDAEILQKVQKAALARLEQVKGETGYLTDPSSEWLLAHVANRCLDIRPPDWPLKREEEPVGVRIKAKDGAQEAIVVFSWSEQVIGPRVLLLHAANLTADLIPEALEAMDVIGARAGRTEGWAFGPSQDDVFTRVLSDMPERGVRNGRRAEIDGHLLAVAWYGDQEERGKFMDLDMLGWC